MHTIYRKKKPLGTTAEDGITERLLLESAKQAKEMALTIYYSFVVIVFALIRDLKREK